MLWTGAETFHGRVHYSSLQIIIQLQRTCRLSFKETTNVTPSNGLHLESTAGSDPTKGLFYKRSMNERKAQKHSEGMYLSLPCTFNTIQMQRTCRPSF